MRDATGGKVAVAVAWVLSVSAGDVVLVCDLPCPRVDFIHSSCFGVSPPDLRERGAARHWIVYLPSTTNFVLTHIFFLIPRFALRCIRGRVRFERIL